MFIGEYIYTIDQKKRISIPAKFRKALGKKAIITMGLDNCLVVYPVSEWQKLAKKLENLPNGQVDARGFSRIMLSGAVDIEFDKLGRILVPDYLKKYAALNRNIAVLGLSNKIEIWDETKWQEYRTRTEKEIGDMASRLQQLGI